MKKGAVLPLWRRPPERRTNNVRWRTNDVRWRHNADIRHKEESSSFFYGDAGKHDTEKAFGQYRGN